MRIPQQLCVVCLLLSFPAVSQQTALKDPAAMAIAQRSLAAMGGGVSFQDVQASGTTALYGDSGSVTYPITLMGTGVASVRTSITKPSGTRTYVTDGSGACIDGTPAKAIADSQFDQYARRIDFIPALTILREYAASNTQVQYAGTDIVAGVTVDVIALSFLPPGIPLGGFDGYKATQRLFYIDRKSSLLLKIQFVTVIDANAAQGPKTEVYFSQYQTIGGFAVPMYQAMYADGQLAQELVLTSAAFNSGLDSSLFSTNCAVTNAQ